MYDAVQDSYCYPGTSVLENLPGLRDQYSLDEFEKLITAQRAEESFPDGDLDAVHYRAIHKHLFQDVYPWAGEYRTVRIGKDGSAFCYPEHIQEQMEELFIKLSEQNYLEGLSIDDFAREAAEFLSSLNAIHPFREGNGRSQNILLILLAARASHPLNLSGLDAPAFLTAMVTSFRGDNGPLERAIRNLVS